ncbi:LuxR C-terminal-related transcriptional regulator [Jatrophihabitans telluris]|uniref:LuxR C-terminal-related transcriptional regulator n=1 Tax=Jatrophihabitans telluris TaxID=2038343 RepID=A0ABY4QWZ9_9ACTN|nr:LuxR C-terminal-related transcriptional regulator [Jatrophihabitans telluris]UQX88173.1 LuxR C-terminal-related transcriptional regulator [Jatrophihabitans telluris]
MESPALGPLVRGKVSPPSLSVSVVLRGRLFQQLTQAVRRPLTLLEAPAGWGKTLLAASWLQSQPPQQVSAWLSLDANDNDPIRFWTYLVAALRVGTGVGDDQPLETLRPPQDPEDDLDVFLSLLVSALVELRQHVIVVVDDVHHITDARILKDLTFLLDHCGENLRLVLLGRHRPALPVPRMRLNGQVSEIRIADLAFSEEEAAQLFTPEDVEVDADQLRTLCTRTEGWAAGLRLAVLMLSGEGDQAAVLAGFAGSSEPVAEYLLSEVVANQPPDVRDFLLRTSICERINAELATELTGRSDAGEVLEALAARSIFLVAHGPGRQWYRYHQMFAELLRDRLRQGFPELANELHQRAATWSELQGLAVDAVGHAADAGDWDRACELLLSMWLRIYLAGQVVLLASLLRRIMPHAGGARPALHAVSAVMHFAQGDALSGEGELAAAERGRELSARNQETWEIAINVARGELARLRVDVEAARSSTSLLLEREGDAPAELAGDARALALFNLAVSEYWSGGITAAEANLRHASALASGAGRQFLTLACQSQLAAVLTAQDRPIEACDVAQAATAFAERYGWSESGVAAEAWHALGWSHYLFGDPDLADQYLDRAEDAARGDEPAIRGTIRLVQGLVLSLRGNKRSALAAVEAAAQELVRVRDEHVFMSYAIGERIRLSLVLGRVSLARRLLADALEEPGTERPRHVLIAQAEMLLADGYAAAAVRVLERAAGEDATGFLDQRLQAMVLLALVQHQLGRRTLAVDTMLSALQTASTQRMIQPFLQFSVPAFDLLRSSSHAHRAPEFLSEVLATFDLLMPDARPVAAGAQQLTDRELQVLRLLDTLLALPEIGAELYVSVNTVKAHLKNLYRKLEVSSRRHAVDRARELGLL